MATAISASAFNLGAAGGSALGAQALGVGFGLDDLAWIGAAVALPALATATGMTLAHHKTAHPLAASDAGPVPPSY